MHGAAIARKALLEPQMETKQAAIRLTKNKVESSREHQAITPEIKAVQNEKTKENVN